MKKIFLTVCLLFTALALPTLVSAEVKEAFYDNYEEYDVGQYGVAAGMNAIYSTGGGRVYVEENPYAPQMGKSLHTTKDSTFFTTQWNMTQPTAIKTYAPYFSISMRIIPEENATFALYVSGNASKEQNISEYAVDSVVLFMGAGQMMTGGPKAGVAELVPGEIYDVNIVINTKGGEPNTAVYEIYINEEKQTKFSVPMMAGKANSTRINLTGIGFLKMESTNMFIDDLCVRTGEKTDVEALRTTMPKFEYTEEEIAKRNSVKKYFNTEVEVENKFADLADSPYAGEIAFLESIGAVKVPENGYYRPKDNITRAELAELCVNLANVTIYRYRNAFLDIDRSKWYANSVQSAVNACLIADVIVKSGYYFPESPASISDVITYGVCIREKYNVIDEAVSVSNYVDYKGLDNEYREYFGKAVGSGVYTPNDIYLNPDDTVTREEAAHIIYNAIKDI